MFVVAAGLTECTVGELEVVIVRQIDALDLASQESFIFNTNASLQLILNLIQRYLCQIIASFGKWFGK